MKVKLGLLIACCVLVSFSVVYALRVVYVGEIDLLVYCENGTMEVTKYPEGYIHVHCEPHVDPPAEADEFVYLPMIVQGANDD